jgi:hypothetical protein
MQAMLLDPTRRAAARSAFAAQPPSKLINRDLKPSAILRTGQLPRRRHRGASAAHDRHFDWPVFAHDILK